MRRAFLLFLLIPLGGSVVAQQAPESALAQARADYRAARAEAKRLEAEAGKAKDKATALGIERRAAAARIAAAEAEISTLQRELANRERGMAIARSRLAAKEAPAAALVGGLVAMGRRPPLIALADGGAPGDLVRVRLLLDATLPVIRKRSAALARDLAAQRRLADEARSAAERLATAKSGLRLQQERFATLEREAIATSSTLGGAALEASDRMMLASDATGRLADDARARAQARALARATMSYGILPPRPGAQERRADPVFPYVLPADGAILDGVGSINRDGVRSRGVKLATRRGQRVRVPADGTVAFAGPYRDHDGVVIIDHGDKRLTMLVGVRSDRAQGDRVRRGEELGIALGEIGVELVDDGRPVSAPMAAVRSLSIQEKQR